MTRRRLLGAAAGMAVAAASTLMPPNLRRALAETSPRQGSLRDIKHVVLLMQENRSFDHYFGTLAGVRGFGDDKALKLPNGKSVFYQPDEVNPSGYLLPFHLDTRITGAQKSPRPATRGLCNTTPGTAVRWTTGCRLTARPMGPRRLTSWGITKARTSRSSSR